MRPLAPLVVGSVALAALFAAPSAAVAAVVAAPVVHSAPDAALSLAPIGTFESGAFDESAAEIVEYYASGKRLFVVDALAGAVQVLDLSDPANPVDDGTVSASGVVDAAGTTIPSGASINSVSVRPDGLVAAAVQSDVKTDAGWVLFFDGDTLAALGAVRVGALPDMVTFTPDGTRVLVAGEGEPSDDYTIDPLGTIGIIATAPGRVSPGSADVVVTDFSDFEGNLPAGVRVFGPQVGGGDFDARNLEPEYIAVSADSTTAWATLQENNAIATVDIASGTITDVVPLGVKDWADPAAGGLDPSNLDGGIEIAPWPVLGMYQPDAIAAYTAGGTSYLVTANEGDARAWGSFEEDERVADLALCPSLTWTTAGGTALTSATIAEDANLGRLSVSTADGFDSANGCYSELYTHGARSFSVWDENGALVWDSGSDFEDITAAALPGAFNATNDDQDSFDNRSDDKGPEPEGIALGEIGDRTYAFIGFERVGGIAVYDITDPSAPFFSTYVNNRDFAELDAEAPAAGDLGPEGLTFISAAESPTGSPLLAVGNEVSGTTTIFQASLLSSGTAPVVTGPPALGTTPSGQLAATGPDAAPIAIAGAAALLAGLSAVVTAPAATRRRRAADAR